jgi:hypothetical protein
MDVMGSWTKQYESQYNHQPRCSSVVKESQITMERRNDGLAVHADGSSSQTVP